MADEQIMSVVVSCSSAVQPQLCSTFFNLTGNPCPRLVYVHQLITSYRHVDLDKTKSPTRTKGHADKGHRAVMGKEGGWGGSNIQVQQKMKMKNV